MYVEKYVAIIASYNYCSQHYLNQMYIAQPTDM